MGFIFKLSLTNYPSYNHLVISLLAIAVFSPNLHTFYSSLFRVGPTATNYVVQVTSSPEEPTMMDLIELGGNGRKLVTSTRLGSSEVYKVSTHTYKGCSLLALASNGQYGQTVIYRIDPKTMRPVELLDALMGDPSRLDKGMVVENSFPSTELGSSIKPS